MNTRTGPFELTGKVSGAGARAPLPAIISCICRVRGRYELADVLTDVPSRTVNCHEQEAQGSPVTSDRRTGGEKARWVTGLSVVYALSGFCALIYQTIWIHEFSIVFGSTIFATSVVISVFFGGMALGQPGVRQACRSAPRTRYGSSPFSRSASGSTRLPFPCCLRFSGKLYAVAYPFAATGLIQATLVRMALALLVLIVPTTLMGGTFPLLVRHLVRRLGEVGARAGLLYGVNALGRRGRRGSERVLLPAILRRCSHQCAGRRPEPGRRHGGRCLQPGGTRLDAPESIEVAPQDAVERPVTSRPLMALTMGCFALTGLVSMAYEIYWLRYLALVMGDTIHLYTGIIAVFVFGIGLGSVLMGSLASRTRWPVALFGLIELGTGAFTVIAVYATALGFEPITRSVQGHGALLLPSSVRAASHSRPAHGRQVPGGRPHRRSRACKAWETRPARPMPEHAGRRPGLVALRFLFLPPVRTQGTLFVLFAGSMVSAALLIGADPRFRRILTGLPLILAVILPLASPSILGGRLPDALLKKMTASAQEELLEVREGLVGTTSVTRSPEYGFVLYDNGVLIGGEQRGNFRDRRLHPGAGAARTAETGAQPGLFVAAGVLLCVAVARLAATDHLRRHLPGKHRRCTSMFSGERRTAGGSRTRFVIDDAYNFVNYSEDLYDLILMEPTPPMYSFRCASLYTKEFYAHAAKRLAPNALFAQVIPLGNLSSVEARSVMKTFRLGVSRVLALVQRPGQRDDRVESEGCHRCRRDRPASQGSAHPRGSGALFTTQISPAREFHLRPSARFRRVSRSRSRRDDLCGRPLRLALFHRQRGQPCRDRTDPCEPDTLGQTPG